MRAALSHARLVIDILSMKLLVWILGRGGALLDSHLFFYHRYIALADHHWLHGQRGRAMQCEAIAEAHFQAAPGDEDPPPATAIAMPVPLPPIRTDAVSAQRVRPKPDTSGHAVHPTEALTPG